MDTHLHRSRLAPPTPHRSPSALSLPLTRTTRAYQFSPDLSGHLHGQESPPGHYLIEGLDGKNAKTSGLLPIVKVAFAYTRMNHWDGVLRWFESQITNGILEGLNSLIQSAETKARGNRTHKNFINMAYLILGKLDLKLPT